MVSAIRERVTVQAGGRIEIRSSQLPAGTEAEVIVMVESPAAERQSLRNLIGKGRGCFATAQEADQFIRGERKAWES